MLILPFRRIVPSVNPVVIPGSVSYTTPGTYSLTVPNFKTITMDVRGPGGGGGGAGCNDVNTGGWNNGVSGSAGNPHSTVTIPGWAALWGYVGGGGGGSIWLGPGGGYQYQDGAAGAAGGAANGDSNITGGGAAGGTGGNVHGGYNPAPRSVGGNGGYGGRCVRTFTRAQAIVQARQTLTIVVGGGGAQGSNGPNPQATYAYPQPGSSGAVYISWS
jgi:hypothetical protein